MNKGIKKILVCGYGWTGSTALIDMFEEYKTISVIPGEFDDFKIPGSVGDAIVSKLNNQKVEVGPSKRSDSRKDIMQFILRGLVPNALWPKSFRGGSIDRSFSLKLGVNLLKERTLYNKCMNDIVSASSEEEVFEIATNWIDSIVNIHVNSTPFVVFDQPIIYDCHGDYWPKVFNDSKLIVVSRNPLDQMGAILRDAPQLLRAPNWYVRFLYGRDSYVNRPLSFFMDTTLERYTLISETYNRIGAENMLVVQFESLVNDYKATKKSIESFIGVNSADHSKVFEYFKPDESKARLVARGELCDATYAKAEKLEKTYLNMLLDVNAI